VRNCVGAVEVEKNDNKERIQSIDTEERERTSIQNNSYKESMKSNHSETIQSNTIIFVTEM